MTTAAPRAFAVRFRELDRWDPGSFHSITWRWPPSELAPIRDLVRVRKEKVDRREILFSELQPITLHFDGSIDRRRVDPGREYSMDLLFARPGDIVVAKIDLKNGAVGVVPDWPNVVVTGHFAVCEPDLSKLVPAYLVRVIQTPFFQAHLWRNKVGAEGRKEVKLDFFEACRVPLPPLGVQRAILAHWEAARQAVAAADERARRIESEAEVGFLAELGLRSPAQVAPPKAFAVWWGNFSRWSVSHNQASATGADVTKGRYRVVTLGSILDLVQYGTSAKANTRANGVPVLRINNIKRGELDITDLKHVDLPVSTLTGLVLQDGDILVIRTSGSRDLVGTCAVFHEKGRFVYASYLIRMRATPGCANPDYVVWFLNSRLGRAQIDATSRQIMQSNINSQELRSLQIPLPPLDIQQAIVARVRAAREEAARERETAKCLAARTEAEVEEMILGTRPVPPQGERGDA